MAVAGPAAKGRRGAWPWLHPNRAALFLSLVACVIFTVAVSTDSWMHDAPRETSGGLFHITSQGRRFAIDDVCARLSVGEDKCAEYRAARALTFLGIALSGGAAVLTGAAECSPPHSHRHDAPWLWLEAGVLLLAALSGQLAMAIFEIDLNDEEFRVGASYIQLVVAWVTCAVAAALPLAAIACARCRSGPGSARAPQPPQQPDEALPKAASLGGAGVAKGAADEPIPTTTLDLNHGGALLTGRAPTSLQSEV